MVHTQAQHIFLALTALAVVAGPLGGAAAALPGNDGQIDLVLDGSVRGRLDEQVAAPASLPLAGSSVGQDAAVRVRTYDLVLPAPSGAAYGAAGSHLGAPLPVAVGPDGVAVTAGGRVFLLPWYYMMDDASARPYHALFWDTGTSWYVDLGDALWQAYAPAAPANPVPLVDAVAPDVWLRTGVEEIDLVASVNVLLQSAMAAAEPGTFARPDAPGGLGATPPRPASEFLAFAAPALAAALPAAPAPGAHAAPGEVVHAAQTAGPAPLAFALPLEAAAAGAVTLLAGVALYHLIRKNAILKNKVRGSIAEHVLRQPGSTITEIAQAVGVTHQTASYHLRLLQEHGLVLGVERGNKRLYFRNDGSFNNEERGLVAVLRDPESMRVLELIRANPWIMKNEAAAALGVSRNTLNWHLQKLLAAGLVSEARENGHCFLFCNRRAAGEVLSQVVQKVQERKGPALEAAPPQAPAGAGPGLGLPAVEGRERLSSGGA